MSEWSLTYSEKYGLERWISAEMQRTCIPDFHLALKAVDDLLAKYAAGKGDAEGTPKWRTQEIDTHIHHGLLHGENGYGFIRGKEFGQEEDLLSMTCRSLMALQLYLEAKQAEKPVPPPKP